MIRKLEQSHDQIIGFSVSGELTDDEYATAISQMRDQIAQHGTIRVLFRVHEVSPKSLLSGLKERADFLGSNADDVDRIAVVADGIAGDLLSLAGNLLPDVEVTRFDPDDEEKAWAWLE